MTLKVRAFINTKTRRHKEITQIISKVEYAFLTQRRKDAETFSKYYIW